MDPIAIALVVAGIVTFLVGAWQARGPLLTIRRLDATAANLDRYEQWRGKRTAVEPEGPTGADVMRAQMRKRAMLWGALAGAGLVLLVVGLLMA